jgi:hypothetical protein
MARSKDLLDVSDTPVFYINWRDLSVVEEVLIPSCSNDWTWYSYRNDCYLMESDLFDSKVDAAEFLLGHMIAMKNDKITDFKKREKELIDIICPNVSDELIG